MKIKTNREWLADNAEFISHKIVVWAMEWAIKKYGRKEAYKMTGAQALDAWLDAPHVEQARENSVIFTIEVKKYFNGEPPLPDVLEREAERIAEKIRHSGTAGASVTRIQVLVGDGK